MENKTGLISLIVPVYKAEGTLARCVDSILAQTYIDFELLLIDDGSPDNSGTLCDEYAKKDRRVRVFHKLNGGVSSARNLGLDNAQGEYISFVDSDDCLIPSFLEEGMKFSDDLIIINHITFENDLSIDNFLKDYKKPEVVCINQFSTKDEIKNFYEKDFWEKPYLQVVWGKLYRKEIIKDICFNPMLKAMEDTEYEMKVFENVRSITFIDQPLYIYYRPEHFLKKYSLKIDDAYILMDYILKIKSQSSFSPKDYERHIFEVYLYLCKRDIYLHPFKLLNNQSFINSAKEIYKTKTPKIFLSKKIGEMFIQTLYLRSKLIFNKMKKYF